MMSLDGPGSWTGSGIDVRIAETYFTCEHCQFKGFVEVYDGYVECPNCTVEVLLG